MRKELDDCLVASDLAEPVHDFEEVGYVLGDGMLTVLGRLLDEELEEFKDR